MQNSRQINTNSSKQFTFLSKTVNEVGRITELIFLLKKVSPPAQPNLADNMFISLVKTELIMIKFRW